MTDFRDIESFRYIKAARRLLNPTSSRLEELVRSDCSDELRFESLLSLGKIGDIQSLAVLTHAFDQYFDCIEPITALGYFKSSTPVPRLLERLQNPDAPHKEEIVRVLGDIGDPMAARTLMELLHDEDRMVRYYAARALYKMGGRDVVQSLCSLLNDPDEWIVINVLEILAQLKDPEAVPALVGQFEIARDSRLKAIIISSLAAFAETRLLKTFESGLASFDPRIQANSVEAISYLKIPASEMKRKLKKFYGHPNNRVRANVCIALAESDSEAVRAELDAMMQSPDHATRRSAAYVLARVNIARREECIHELLLDEYFGVRKMALKAVLSLESGVGVREIRPLLSDENQWVRKEAVECALRIEDFPDTDILDLLKKEESASVIKCVLDYVVSRHLIEAVAAIYERIRKEPEEELPWLIAALGHLGARDELIKIKKSLGAIRSEVFSEYYQALLLNGELTVFDEIATAAQEKKRENELLVWARIAGNIGAFIQQTERYSTTLYRALFEEVQRDMEGVATLDARADDNEVRMEKALTAFNNGDFAGARDLLVRVIEAEPDKIEARYYLANSQYNLGEMSKAAKTLAAIIDDEPSHIDAAILLGQIYFRKKDWDHLAACYERVQPYVEAGDKKNLIRIYGALGLAYFNQKKYQQAITALSRGLQANPRDLSSSYHLALCYYALEQGDKAKTILEGLRKTLPPDSQVLKNVVELLQRI